MQRSGLKCVSCGKVAKEAKLRFQGYNVKGWKCEHCGETYYNPEDAQKILLLNKILKKKYEVKIGKVRSNLIIRIPSELAEAMGLTKGEKIKIIANSAKTFYVEA
jgi:hypothetical protein